MRSPTVIVTGANSGIGKATAKALASKGANVVLACRNERKGQIAKQELLAQVPYGNFTVLKCDLNDLKQLHEFVEEFKKRFDSLDILINNAGVVTLKNEVTAQGFEKMLGVNHLGHFYLTEQLLPLIQRSNRGRIIILSSGAYKWGDFDESNANLTEEFSIAKAYGRSKLANLWYVHALSERLKHSHINVMAVHPGAVSTSLGVDRSNGFGEGIHRMLRPFFLSAEKGARTSVSLALRDDVVNGGYYYKGKIKAVDGIAKDLERAKHLERWSYEAIEQALS
ncbi:SDR family oxidoreductase [Geomicrobium sediminis]|uniref:NAD(P)-dependent dehydrogenase (Short-subunit alcohol dehydrogenase family) n=1 Tax=Geomicrobium sediminis TaxID=1347788 RepID=A0ABS2PDN5_9BACL|nr:SDR family oxidoreductase [Geomicrobium sediminis]MBM7633387.1 NAD(P)-dependent dehydrogenase (short-subunit alcohol dehydrogenase family) [Geomicrobium sediminis]